MQQKIETDSIRNICKGNARVHLKVDSEEDLENMKINFMKRGIDVKGYNEKKKNKKKTGLFEETQKKEKTPIQKGLNSHRLAKQHDMSSKADIFGGSK